MFALNPQDLSFETAEVGLRLAPQSFVVQLGFARIRLRAASRGLNPSQTMQQHRISPLP
jgi:hypothetical protein